MSRVLAIGDIHGCARALATLIAAIEPLPEDLVIPLGDYVDRGPDSKGVLEQLLALRERTTLVPLIGNHDAMMLQARDGQGHDWLRGYGRSTLASYGLRAEELGRVPREHWAFLEGCRDWFETGTHIFAHASVQPDLPMPEQPSYVLRWESLRPGEVRAHCSGKTLVCGHTSQKDGRPLDLGHTVCIDTYAHGGGWLTCLEATSGWAWQANQAGLLVSGRLEELARPADAAGDAG